MSKLKNKYQQLNSNIRVSTIHGAYTHLINFLHSPYTRSDKRRQVYYNTYVQLNEEDNDSVTITLHGHKVLTYRPHSLTLEDTYWFDTNLTRGRVHNLTPKTIDINKKSRSWHFIYLTLNNYLHPQLNPLTGQLELRLINTNSYDIMRSNYEEGAHPIYNKLTISEDINHNLFIQQSMDWFNNLDNEQLYAFNEISNIVLQDSFSKGRDLLVEINTESCNRNNIRTWKLVEESKRIPFATNRIKLNKLTFDIQNQVNELLDKYKLRTPFPNMIRLTVKQSEHTAVDKLNIWGNLNAA